MSLKVGKNTYLHINPTDIGSTWRGFAVGSDYYLLHVPSAHLIASHERLITFVNSDSHNEPSLLQELADIAKQLPAGYERQAPEIDIKGISLNVIQSCNLRCTYCYAGDGDYGSDSKMSLETAKQTVDFFSKGKTSLHINFFGGEPLMNLALIKEVVAYCREKPKVKFFFSMTSNGTLLNEQTLAFLKENGVTLTISYDGKGLHGAQRLNIDRKTSSEALVERKLATFKKDLEQLPGFGLRATIHKDNLGLIKEALFSTLREKDHEYTFVRNAEKGAKAYTAEQAEALASSFREVVSELLTAKEYDQLMKIGNIRTNMLKIHRGRVGDSFCGAGQNYLSVSTTGKFYLCHRFTEDQEECLGDIASGLDEKAITRFSQHRVVEHAPCKHCWMRQWCGGGCYHEHKMANNTTFLPDPLFCYLMNNEMTLALRVYVAVLKDRPDLLSARRPSAVPSRYVE